MYIVLTFISYIVTHFQQKGGGGEGRERGREDEVEEEEKEEEDHLLSYY